MYCEFIVLINGDILVGIGFHWNEFHISHSKWIIMCCHWNGLNCVERWCNCWIPMEYHLLRILLLEYLCRHSFYPVTTSGNPKKIVRFSVHFRIQFNSIPIDAKTQRLKRISSVSASNRLAGVQSISIFDASSNIDNNHDKDTISNTKKSKKFHFRTDFPFYCRLVHRDLFLFALSPVLIF